MTGPRVGRSPRAVRRPVAGTGAWLPAADRHKAPAAHDAANVGGPRREACQGLPIRCTETPREREPRDELEVHGSG